MHNVMRKLIHKLTESVIVFVQARDRVKVICTNAALVILMCKHLIYLTHLFSFSGTVTLCVGISWPLLLLAIILLVIAVVATCPLVCVMLCIFFLTLTTQEQEWNSQRRSSLGKFSPCIHMWYSTL